MKKRLLPLILVIALIAGNAAFAQVAYTLDLTKPVVPEQVEFDEDGSWTGTYTNDKGLIAFGDESSVATFMFSHSCINDPYSYWDGFTIANSGDTENKGALFYQAPWGNMAAGGIKTDESGNPVLDENGKVITEKGIPYLVAYWAEYMEWEDNHSAMINLGGDTYEAGYLYVASNPYAYYTISEGNYLGISFAEGDYFKLWIHGLDGDLKDNGKKVEYTLAEFRDGVLWQNESWEKLDISGLGEIGGLYFTMESTDVSEFGINTPTYFCMDKLTVYKSGSGIEQTESVLANVFPNPASDVLKITNNTRIDQVVITDISGKTIYRNDSVNDLQLTVPVSHLAQGIYAVKIVSGTKIILKKIIKK